MWNHHLGGDGSWNAFLSQCLPPKLILDESLHVQKKPSDVKDIFVNCKWNWRKPTQNLTYPFCFRHLQNKSRPRSLLSLRKSGSSARDWLLMATVLNRLINMKMLTSSFPLPKKQRAFKKTNKKSQYFLDPQKVFCQIFEQWHFQSNNPMNTVSQDGQPLSLISFRSYTSFIGAELRTWVHAIHVACWAKVRNRIPKVANKQKKTFSVPPQLCPRHRHDMIHSPLRAWRISSSRQPSAKRTKAAGKGTLPRKIGSKVGPQAIHPPVALT